MPRKSAIRIVGLAKFGQPSMAIEAALDLMARVEQAGRDGSLPLAIRAVHVKGVAEPLWLQRVTR